MLCLHRRREKVERPYRWLQDRIVRTCAREGVKEIGDAIEILKEEAERYNFRQRHSVTGEVPYYRLRRLTDEGKSLFREFVLPSPYLSSKDIFALRDERTVNPYRKIILLPFPDCSTTNPGTMASA